MGLILLFELLIHMSPFSCKSFLLSLCSSNAPSFLWFKPIWKVPIPKKGSEIFLVDCVGQVGYL